MFSITICKLDGFINHRNNMFILNDDHDMRKAICEKLFDTQNERTKRLQNGYLY